MIVGGAVDAADEVRDATVGEGVDVVFEAAGTPEALRLALAAARRGGTVVNLALRNAPDQVDLNRLLARELHVMGSTGYAGEHADVIDTLAAGGFGDVTRLITGRVALDEAVEQGFEALVARPADHVKVLVHP